MGADVQLVKDLFAAFERRDVDAIRRLCADDMVFEPVTAQIAARAEPYRGHDGLRLYLADVALVWQEVRPDPTVFRTVGEDTVVATGRIYAWGVGRVVDAPAGWLWRIRDGRIVYGKVFETARAALEAAGLSAG